MKAIAANENMQVTNLGMDEEDELCTFDDIKFMILQTIDPNMAWHMEDDTYIVRLRLTKYIAKLEIRFEDYEIYFGIFRADIGSYISRKCALADKITICGEIRNMINFAKTMY